MKLSVYFFLLCFSVNVSAKVIQGHVYNTDNTPLKNVEIVNMKSQDRAFSDNSGFFEIEGSASDTIAFSLEKYSTIELTVRNIINSNYKILLFQEMRIDLPELTVMPVDMYELYRKSVINLKNRFVTNERISYKCTGIEKEVNYGDERGLNLLFTAQTKVSRKKSRTKFNFDTYMSELNTHIGSQDSYILRENRLWTDIINFALPNIIMKDTTNTIQITDSTIVIQFCRHRTQFATYTINKEDTTLIKATVYESFPKQNKYKHLRTFKCKELFYSFSLEFKEIDGRYIFYNTIHNFDYSMLHGNPEREERIICSYKTIVLENTNLNANQKFIPDTKYLYDLKKYP